MLWAANKPWSLQSHKEIQRAFRRTLFPLIWMAEPVDTPSRYLIAQNVRSPPAIAIRHTNFFSIIDRDFLPPIIAPPS